MAASGEISGRSWCWMEGWPEWRPVADVVAQPAEPRVPRRHAPPPLPASTPQQAAPSRSQADPHRVANAGLNELLCCRCGLDFTGAPKKTFFIRARKFVCDACGHANTYPPSTRAMVLYAALLIFTALAMIGLLAQGKVPLPGLLAIVAGTGLVEGFFLRRRVRKARNFFRDKALKQP